MCRDPVKARTLSIVRTRRADSLNHNEKIVKADTAEPVTLALSKGCGTSIARSVPFGFAQGKLCDEAISTLRDRDCFAARRGRSGYPETHACHPERSEGSLPRKTEILRPATRASE